VTPELFAAANDSAFNVGLMRHADVWTAVYQWGGFDDEDPPTDDTT
jgi:hypothetical protein